MSPATNSNSEPSLETIVALAKRRGFVFQGSEIYGGLAGTWDYGPLGVALKNNVRDLWWRHFVTERDDMYGLDTAILMNPRVWEASGHTGAGFADILVDCQSCQNRFRGDHLIEDWMKSVNGTPDQPIYPEIFEPTEKIINLYLSTFKNQIACPYCGKIGTFTRARKFNLMFETYIGPIDDTSARVYLRPETAQGMFVNFKNVLDTIHPKLPFGLAQVGKNFRNEITPRDFIFRVRELEIMELEYFIAPGEWETQFEAWHKHISAWFERVGLAAADIHELEVPEADRAHYSKRTVDFEYKFGFGTREIAGFAYRTDFDLKNHMEASGVDLTYVDPVSGEKFVPHVLEPTFGLDRHVLAVMSAAYREEQVGEGDTRVVLGFKPELAPVKVAVFPLLRNKPELVAKAEEIYRTLKAEFGAVMFDDNGNVGKRYRRQDEIGTPLCVTVDFESLEDGQVTVRQRDTMAQERIKITNLIPTITQQLTRM